MRRFFYILFNQETGNNQGPLYGMQQQQQQSFSQQQQPNQSYAPRRGSSFFPDSTSVLPNNTRMNPNPPSTNRVNMKEATLRRMSSDDALQLALLLSEQESRYGVNMYDSLQTTDEPEIQQLMVHEGKTMEEAVLEVFNRKVARKALRRTATALLTTEEDHNQNYSPFTSFGVDNTSRSGAPATSASMMTGNMSSNSSVGSGGSNQNKNGSAYAHQLRPGDPHAIDVRYQLW